MDYCLLRRRKVVPPAAAGRKRRRRAAGSDHHHQEEEEEQQQQEDEDELVLACIRGIFVTDDAAKEVMVLARTYAAVPHEQRALLPHDRCPWPLMAQEAEGRVYRADAIAATAFVLPLLEDDGDNYTVKQQWDPTYVFYMDPGLYFPLEAPTARRRAD